jgi:hypothetical protein
MRLCMLVELGVPDVAIVPVVPGVCCCRLPAVAVHQEVACVSLLLTLLCLLVFGVPCCICGRPCALCRPIRIETNIFAGFFHPSCLLAHFANDKDRNCTKKIKNEVLISVPYQKFQITPGTVNFFSELSLKCTPKNSCKRKESCDRS